MIKVGKLQDNQKGFGAVEAFLVLVIVILVGVIGYMAYNNLKTSNTTTASTKSTTPRTPAKHTAQEAASLVQLTYNGYLAAMTNASGPNNTQPLGLVGLAAVKGNLTSDFYAQAAASHNGGAFSCASQFLPSKYVISLASSTGASASVPVTIWNSDDGSATTSGMTVNVDLASLKITAVSCPS